MDRKEKYEKKRKRVGLTLLESHQKYFIDKMGKIPTADQMLDILMDKPIKIIQIKRDPELRKLYTELSRIGNNLNQIAYNRNANSIINEETLMAYIDELMRIKQEVHIKIFHEN
jgi:hypothetical protein